MAFITCEQKMISNFFKKNLFMKNGKCLGNYRKTRDSKIEFNITVEKE